MKQKKWIIARQKSDNIIEQVLANRQIPKAEWPSFLKPDFKAGVHDPYLLPDMEKAVGRIVSAAEKQETIGIFADYDADGIPAAAVLSEILETKLGLKTLVYIPTRQEGYGLNQIGIDWLKQSGAKLIITADLGVREIKNTEYVKKCGLDMIITDHHEPGEVLPKPLALINPKLKNSRYPFRELSGGGVVFKLVQALAKKFPQITDADLKWLLDLVGITTICDVVPLIDENRIFAKFGLIVLAKTRRVGLKKLYQAARIDAQKINTYTVGFQIGPRLNAPGRMGQTTESFKLLRSENENEALKLALRLDQINRNRQAKLEEILYEAEEKILKNKLNEKKVILLVESGWASGLIGLVAGKIVEKYNRPTVILEKGELESRGSARSIDNFNLVEALENASDLLKNFGGHTKAAGLTVENKNLEAFYDRLLATAEEKLKDEDLIPKVYIDAVLAPKDLSLGLYCEVTKLEPFGLGNPRPIFVLENVALENLRTLGENNKHLRFRVGETGAIAFGWGEALAELKDKKVDLAFSLDEDSWDGTKKLQLKIIDLK